MTEAMLSGCVAGVVCAVAWFLLVGALLAVTIFRCARLATKDDEARRHREAERERRGQR